MYAQKLQVYSVQLFHILDSDEWANFEQAGLVSTGFIYVHRFRSVRG